LPITEAAAQSRGGPDHRVGRVPWGEQFATIAHASRNTQIPFMVLKDRVVNQGKTLDAAIREWKPDINAKAEASRARAEAREDIAKIQS
jgi:hypothetical protein